MDEEKYFSQYGQDRYLDKNVFKGRKGGVFVDVGANDGITYSNTYFMEKYRGWTGICIEPHPTAFLKLVQNRSCDSLNIGISSKEAELEFLKVDGYAEMLSGLKSNYDAAHLNRIEEEILVNGGTKETILVACKRLEKILLQKKIQEVDYCSIDIEGGELEVLESLDLKAKQIKVFSIENNYFEDRLKKYMADYKYKLIKKIKCDEIYQVKRSAWSFFY
jgi:FkbM family methyltransferase